MTDPSIIEAAERALKVFPHDHIIADDYSYMAEAVIAAVTHLIEASALERAAQIADDRPDSIMKGEAREIAAAIRALKQ